MPGSTLWNSACLRQSCACPKQLNRRELAELAPATMEGGVMQARTHRSAACFDRAVRQLRTHFGYFGRGNAPEARYDVQLMPTRTSPCRAPRKRKAGSK
jgi:hypothetical protein